MPRPRVPDLIQSVIDRTKRGIAETGEELVHRRHDVRVRIEGAARETDVGRTVLSEAAHQILATADDADGKSAAVLAGGLIGLGNGLLITGLRVVPFIATLGMLGIARGIAKWLAHEQTVNVAPTWVNDLLVTFPRQAWMVLPPGVWITLALAVLTATVLRRTVFGRRVFALGSNELAARACGIATERLKLAIYGSAGLFFAGVMQLSRLRQGDPTVAIGTELDVIAAVVIGGGSLQGGEGSVFGSVVGALIMAFLRNGCQQMGWPNYIQEIIIGGIIVLAVALDRLRAGWSTP